MYRLQAVVFLALHRGRQLYVLFFFGALYKPQSCGYNVDVNKAVTFELRTYPYLLSSRVQRDVGEPEL